jgi:protoheme IX farnesyltransferase
MLAGVALAAGGTMALNQYLERDLDALMRRTRERPLPAGRLEPGRALRFGVAIAAGGLFILVLVDPVCCSLTALIVASYLMVYTPLKKRTPLSSIVGGIPGALPPVVGWFAAGGELEPMAGLLFGVLFLWQIPHLLAISWLYRRDYARAGFRLLPVVDPDGQSTAWLTVSSCVLLAVVGYLLCDVAAGGLPFVATTILLSTGFTACGMAFARTRSHLAARRLLLASYVYLPAFLVAAVIAGTSP